LLKKLKYLVVLISIISIDSFGQDPTFSQFYANALYLSPSFAGATEDYRYSMNVRDQWPAIPGVFMTYSLSFDKAMPNFNSGIGVLATYDVAGSGDLSTTNIGLVYSYDFNINKKWHIRPGVNFKFYYLGLNIGKLLFNSQSTLPLPHLFIMKKYGQVLLSIICLLRNNLFTGMILNFL
jgi:type IX secretion system PorP/SprF family membrane protein